MFWPVPLRKWFFLALALCAGAAQARTLELEARRISTAVARVETLALSIDWKAGAATGALKLDAAMVDAGEFGYAFRDASWRCELRRHSITHYGCDGPIRARKLKSANLRAEWRDGELMLALTSPVLLVLVTVAMLVIPVIGVIWWSRSVRAGRSSVGRDLGRWLFVVLGQLLAIAFTFLIVNNQFAFYTSWTDLFGPNVAETAKIRSQG